MSRLILAKVVLASFLPMAQAAQTVINFDDLGPSVIVGSHYAAQGVHFLNAKTSPTRIPSLTPFGSYPGASFPTALVSMEAAFNGFQPQPSTAIVAYFDFDAVSVTVTGLGVNEHGFLLRAYDQTSGGVLVASVQVFGPPHPPDDVFFNLTATATKIRRVEFSQVLQLNAPTNSDDIWFDNVSVTPVPEPEQVLLLTSGLALVCLTRRRATRPSR